jgi:hypothetical protein
VAVALQNKELGAATKHPAKGAWLLMGRVRERFVPKSPLSAAKQTPAKKNVNKAKLSPNLKPEPELQSIDIDWTVQDGEGKPRAQFSTPFTADVALLAAAKLYSALKPDVEATVAARSDAEPIEPLPAGVKAAAAPRAAIVKITGAPGDGERTLSRAIALMLGNTGITISNADDVRAWRVGAVVDVKKAGPKVQISLIWRVLDAKGFVLGEVAQNNEVPAGRLAKTWGETAVLAAAAAAPGLAEVIAKAHNSGLDPQDAPKSGVSSTPDKTKP